MADTQEPTQPPDSDSIQTTTNNPLSLIEKDQQQLEEKSIDVDSDGPNHTPQRVSIEKPTDWSQYTLKRRPWRPCVTDFSRIIEAKYRGSGTPSDPYIVQWLDDDPCNPKTYSMKRKTILSALLAFMTLCISLASSAYTGPSESIMEEFHCSEEIFLLGLTFFVLGFGTGPLVFGPLSEALGRRNILMLSMIFYTIWTGICIAAQNIQSLIVFRALAGTIGSAAFVIPGGQIADMFDAEQRGVVIAIYSAAPFLGPTLGPMIGGFIDLGASWRWLFGVLTLYSGALTFFGLLIVPETYAPVLLRQRAKLLTKVTGKTHMTKIDIDNPLTFHKMVRKSLVLPWALLFREPIVLLLTVRLFVSCLQARFPLTLELLRSTPPLSTEPCISASPPTLSSSRKDTGGMQAWAVWLSLACWLEYSSALPSSSTTTGATSVSTERQEALHRQKLVFRPSS